MSTQLFEEDAPPVAAPKNGRSTRNTPAPTPETLPSEPEISLSDPFADEPEVVAVAPTPEPEAPVIIATVTEEPKEPIAPPAPTVTPAPRAAATVSVSGPRQLPDERQSLTLTLKAGGCDGLVIVGLFEDGTPGEVLLLLRNAPVGAAAALEAFAATLTLALPYGVPAGVMASQLLGLITDSNAREAATAITTSLSARF
ncbi:hypothetical protein [Armatimonas sp.]|uniref:hypothetical protein n=1 Tax=Armatimonas sp. TaxID=1872638 RepID=UPI00286D5474|nr:hypothetical protein [Armatimonas sp.]